MYEVHDWAEVHRLFHREGMSKSRISERLGMGRNTVARSVEPGLSRPGIGGNLGVRSWTRIRVRSV